MNRAPLIAGLSVVAMLSGLVGCASPYNDRSTLGRGDVTIEAIADPGPVYGPIVDGEELLLDRSNWEWVTYTVPVDGTMHNPTWRWWNGHNTENARDRGEFPDEQTALILKGDDSGAEVAEGFFTPFVALGEIITMPVLLFVDNQFRGSWSPKWDYERSRQAAAHPSFSDEPAIEFVPAAEPEPEAEHWYIR